MARALIAVGALLAVAFGVLLLVVFATREEDRVAVDDLLALELTRSIGVSDGGDVDLRRLARGDWDRVLVVAPGTPRGDVSEALGSEFKGDLPFGSGARCSCSPPATGSCASPTTAAGRRSTGSSEPVDELARADAMLRVRGGVWWLARPDHAAHSLSGGGRGALGLRPRARLRLRLARVAVRALVARPARARRGRSREGSGARRA